MYKPYQQFLLPLQNTAKLRKLPAKAAITPKNLNFSTNDYLQLRSHPHVTAAARAALDAYGAGASGSRLLSGNYSLIEDFEQEIAKNKHTEAALIFPSGFQANATVLASILDKKVLKQPPLVFFDKLNHASLYQALWLSQTEYYRYQHLNMQQLEDLLIKNQHHHRPKFIVSETLFGMEGDCVNLADLIFLSKKYQTFLYLDEAHATGILGSQGYGLTTQHCLNDVEHLIMGSFSKALGSQGAYIACHSILKEFLINHCQGFIYTTACSPVNVAAAQASWKLLPSLQAQREKILSLAQNFATQLTQYHFMVANFNTHIVSLILKDESKTLELQAYLEQHQIRASAIRPPTVPPQSARLRFAIHAGIQQRDLDYVVEVLLNS